jgi:hypothetical protein
VCSQPAGSIASAVPSGLSKYPFHHVVAAGADLADRSGWQRLAGRRVGDLDLYPGMGTPQRPGAVGWGVIQPGLGDDRRGLGLPVRHAESGFGPADQGWGEDGAAAVCGPDAGQVPAGEVRMIELGHHHRGHAAEHGAALGLDQVQDQTRVETRREDLGKSSLHRSQRG